MNDIISEILIESILITTLLSIISFVFFRREKLFEQKLKYKHEVLKELLGPIRMQLIRSKITLKHYKADNHSFKEQILKQCNETVRNTLLENGHLIPEDLIEHSANLISHYDRWLQAYHKWRVESNDQNREFVFVGGFPKDAEKMFNRKYESFKAQLQIEKQ